MQLFVVVVVVAVVVVVVAVVDVAVGGGGGGGGGGGTNIAEMHAQVHTKSDLVQSHGPLISSTSLRIALGTLVAAARVPRHACLRYCAEDAAPGSLSPYVNSG